MKPLGHWINHGFHEAAGLHQPLDDAWGAGFGQVVTRQWVCRSIPTVARSAFRKALRQPSTRGIRSPPPLDDQRLMKVLFDGPEIRGLLGEGARDPSEGNHGGPC